MGGDMLAPTRSLSSPPLTKNHQTGTGQDDMLCHSFIYLIGPCQGRANVHFPNFVSIINQNWFYISLNIKLLAPGGSSSSYSKTSVSSFRIDVL